MKASVVALWVATTSGWLIAIAAITGLVEVMAAPMHVLGLVIIVSIVAWAIEQIARPVGNAAAAWVWWFLYTVLLVSASAWYVQACGEILIIELVLPTMAVLLVMGSLRAWVVHHPRG